MSNWPHTTVNASALNASLTPPHGHSPGFLPNEEVASGGEWVEKWGVG